MIRRNTWVLLFILAGLIGLTFYLKNQQTRAEAEATPTAGISYLFTSAEGLPSGIKIEAATGESVEVTREANGKWVLKAPVQAEADQGLVEAAATQVGSLR